MPNFFSNFILILLTLFFDIIKGKKAKKYLFSWQENIFQSPFDSLSYDQDFGQLVSAKGLEQILNSTKICWLVSHWLWDLQV